MKKICFVAVFALISAAHIATAQYKDFKPVADYNAFQKRFSELSSGISSISSSFAQEKVLSALAEKITSTGFFMFAKDDKVKIEYVKPFSYLMIMNGDKLYIKDQGKESTLNIRSNKLFQQVNRIMLDCVNGSILESKDFASNVYENEKSYLLKMTPISKLLKELFADIILIVDKKDGAVDSIQMNEPSGDYTRMIFSNKKLNVPISDEVFAL